MSATAGYAMRMLMAAEREMAFYKDATLRQERGARIDRQKFEQAWREANDARHFLGLPLLSSTELEF